jgi:hypothetical protein
MIVDFKKVPERWAVCLNGSCPLKDKCLRFQVGLQMPEDTKAWTTVLPGAMRSGRCEAYADVKLEHKAYGFRRLYNHVEKKDFRSIKGQVMAYLGGHSTYYRYHRGEKLLSEAQQADISRLFRQFGYDAPLDFEGYNDELQFPFIHPDGGNPY